MYQEAPLSDIFYVEFSEEINTFGLMFYPLSNMKDMGLMEFYLNDELYKDWEPG